jgi:hypothetical protein
LIKGDADWGWQSIKGSRDANGCVKRQRPGFRVAGLWEVKMTAMKTAEKGASSDIRDADNTPRGNLLRLSGEGNVAASGDE